MSQPDGGEWRALQERRKPTDEEWAVAKTRFTSGVVATGDPSVGQEITAIVLGAVDLQRQVHQHQAIRSCRELTGARTKPFPDMRHEDIADTPGPACS